MVTARRKAQLRERIVQTAEELFLKYGVIAVGMDDVARQAGVSKATLYKFFPSKKDLVQEAVERRFYRIISAIEEIKKESSSPVEELARIQKLIFDHLKHQKESPIYQLRRTYPDVAQWLLCHMQEYAINYLQDNIRRGQCAGVYRPEIDSEFTSRLFYASLVGSTEPSIFPAEKYPSAQVSQKLFELFMYALLTDKGKGIWKEVCNS